MTATTYSIRNCPLARVIWFFVLFLAPLLVLPQRREFQFKHLTTQDGLSQSVVTSILQDDKGFMWFGTRDGLNKYDGYKFTVYRNDPEVPGTISNNYVRCLLKDRKGNLWVGTFDGGLSLYDREKDNFIVFRHDAKNENSLRGNGVISLLEDRDELEAARLTI